MVKDGLITTPTINTLKCVNSELHKTENPELALSPKVAASKTSFGPEYVLGLEMPNHRYY
ncbi:hypothetical protein GB937_003587 [Aspergillus fischeri]|nr:hypothetical protein GB937_003587 [Aspergillus fischeri]